MPLIICSFYCVMIYLIIIVLFIFSQVWEGCYNASRVFILPVYFSQVWEGCYNVSCVFVLPVYYVLVGTP
jgi:hypothetical protein